MVLICGSDPHSQFQRPERRVAGNCVMNVIHIYRHVLYIKQSFTFATILDASQPNGAANVVLSLFVWRWLYGSLARREDSGCNHINRYCLDHDVHPLGVGNYRAPKRREFCCCGCKKLHTLRRISLALALGAGCVARSIRWRTRVEVAEGKQPPPLHSYVYVYVLVQRVTAK